MQRKDIPVEPILQFLAGLDERPATWFARADGSPFDNSVLAAMPAGTPPKLALAKMRGLIRRGVVKGCPCGCRGDFTLPR